MMIDFSPLCYNGYMDKIKINNIICWQQPPLGLGSLEPFQPVGGFCL